MLSIYTALCADQVVFNSDYNRSTFLAGAEQLLNKLPDHVPSGLMARLRQSVVIPVPLCEDVFAASHARPQSGERDVLSIVWNHRREFDKGPTLLLSIARLLLDRGVRLRMHLLGQRFRQSPVEFAQLEALLAAHYAATGIAPGHSGYVSDREEYCRLLASADVVLSTALHDFQGLSILEATALGCTPLAPARLVYPEYLPAECLYDADGDIAAQAESAVRVLQQWSHAKSSGASLPRVDVTRFRQFALHEAYANLLPSGT